MDESRMFISIYRTVIDGGETGPTGFLHGGNTCGCIWICNCQDRQCLHGIIILGINNAYNVQGYYKISHH